MSCPFSPTGRGTTFSALKVRVRISQRVQNGKAGALADTVGMTEYRSKHKYDREVLEEAVKGAISMSEVLRNLGVGVSGSAFKSIKDRIDLFEIDTSHFKGKRHGEGKPSHNRKSPEDVFIVLAEGSARPRRRILLRAMIESGVPYECLDCGQGPVWNGKTLVIEIDHIDGDWKNNLLSNLRFLCPNCHSQQVETNLPHKNSKKVKA